MSNEKEIVRQLQQQLVAAGFSDVNPDGQFDPKTLAALQDYFQQLALQPLPPKPWWHTDRMKGLLKMALGGLVLFVPQLANIDTAQLSDTIMNISDHIYVIIQLVAGILALWGVKQNIRGSINAQQPVDKYQIAPGVSLVTRGMQQPNKLYSGANLVDARNEFSGSPRSAGPFNVDS